jgi:hypothetical protein
MGIFKLPFSLCDYLTKLIRDFWWGCGERKEEEALGKLGYLG